MAKKTVITRKIFYIIILITLFSYFISKVSQYYHLFPLLQKDVSTFVNTVWQIQAGISTLPLAILGLLIGLSNKRLYGFNLLQFILIENRKRLAFQDEVILIMFLNILQYYFTANEMIASVGFIFFITIIIVINMTYKSIRVLLFEEEIEKEIKSFILQNCLDYIKKEKEKK